MLKIFGDRRCPDMLLSIDCNGEPASVQKLPLQAIAFGKMLIEVEVPVLIVQHHGITERCEMKPDLMHAPGFDNHARQRGL